MHGLMRFDKFRVFGKDGAFARVVKIFLQSGHATLAGQREELVNHFHAFGVASFGVGIAAENAEHSFGHTNYRRERIGDEYSAYGRAENDDQFGWLNEDQHLSVFHEVTAHNGTENDHNTDD